ncbi:hypothetical protein [Streptomyces bluensis]|uniref:hypothetical protein n=1 Tax=Streptomyces bluensis TaxID=33897 RepID=UPI0033309738
MFLAIEKRADQPIVPLRLFTRRTRAGAYVNLLLIAATLTSMWFFLVQFLQGVLGYDALVAGLAFLPMAVAVFASTSATASRLNSSVYRLLRLLLLPTWHYFLWNLMSQSPGVHDQGEGSGTAAHRAWLWTVLSIALADDTLTRDLRQNCTPVSHVPQRQPTH